MSDQVDTEFLEVVSRQAWQDPLANLILPERGGVLFKTQTAQPLRYVHNVVLGSEERQPPLNDDIPLPFALPATALK